MKILHTSDWHIGRKLYDKSFDETLEHFFKWLKNTVESENIDILIVAGDIFNNPFPSSSSLSLYYKTLYNLSQTTLKHIIIIGGNHDSVSTLNAPKELLNELNISVVGGYKGDLDELIIEIKNTDNETDLVVCAVPFLRERDVRTSFSGNDYKERITQISNGISDFYNQLAEKVADFKKKKIPVIATGHLFVNDIAEMSDEDKNYFVGGLQQLSINQIPDIFDYFALGHIHKPYKIGGKENIRYSGSPIQMNFSERNNNSQVVVIEFNDQIRIKKVLVPVFRELLRFEGTYNEVKQQIDNYYNDKILKPWTDINIIEKKSDPLLEKKLSDLKDSTEKMEIISFKYSFTEVEEKIQEKFKENTTLKDLKPEQIFDAVLENIKEDDVDELKQTFTELINEKLFSKDL